VSTQAERYYREGSELEELYWSRWPSASAPAPWESPPPRPGARGDIRLEEARACYRDAAALGSVRAMLALARRSDGEQRRRWLRQAAEHGDDSAAVGLAGDFAAADMPAEAEQWYRYALDRGQASAVRGLAAVLIGQDRRDEAERLILRYTEEPSAEPSDPLRVRTRIRPDAFSPPEAVIAVVVVTMAVVPFVQAIAAKAGENAYASIRAMVRWLWLRGRAKPGAQRLRRPEDRLLVVEDPDSKLRLAIALGTDTPDKRLRALRNFDLASVADDVQAATDDVQKVVIEWHEPSQSWRAAGQ
jgi:hypothetical protein